MTEAAVPRATVEAWQGALAAEHQAVFGYALLGPRLPVAAQARARVHQAAHEDLRGSTDAALRSAGQSPLAAASDYPALYPVADAGAARRLAVRLEETCAAAWRLLYLQAARTRTVGAEALRTTAQDALTASSVRAVVWRADHSPSAASIPFPGLNG